MKNVQLIFRFGLLCVIILGFVMCKKGAVDPIPSIFNYSTFTDARDGKTYKSIKIGTQEWMAENLAYKTASGSWEYSEVVEYGTTYGRLYTWDAAKLAVPNGWHLPTDAEWKQLELELGMSKSAADGSEGRGTNEGGKLKTKTGWAENGNGTDEVGFLALPGGFFANSGSFLAAKWYGYWWSATETNSSSAWFRLLVANDSKIHRKFSFKGDGYSVRCVKN